MPLGVYQNYVNNQTENGTNPRALEAVYLTHSGLFQSIFESYYDFIPFDPITLLPIGIFEKPEQTLGAFALPTHAPSLQPFGQVWYVVSM